MEKKKTKLKQSKKCSIFIDHIGLLSKFSLINVSLFTESTFLPVFFFKFLENSILTQEKSKIIEISERCYSKKLNYNTDILESIINFFINLDSNEKTIEQQIDYIKNELDTNGKKLRSVFKYLMEIELYEEMIKKNNNFIKCCKLEDIDDILSLWDFHTKCTNLSCSRDFITAIANIFNCYICVYNNCQTKGSFVQFPKESFSQKFFFFHDVSSNYFYPIYQEEKDSILKNCFVNLNEIFHFPINYNDEDEIILCPLPLIKKESSFKLSFSYINENLPIIDLNRKSTKKYSVKFEVIDEFEFFHLVIFIL